MGCADTGTPLSQDDTMIFYAFVRYLEKDNGLPVI